MYSPGRLDVLDQVAMALTHKSPTDKNSFIWYTGLMGVSGTLIRGKVHAHSSVFKESYLFAATPEQLGMAGDRLQPKGKTFEAMIPSDMGFQGIEEIKKHIMEHY